MLTLHTFGAAFGLPDASPFVIKAELLLKLSGQPYQTEPFAGGMRIGPKGKRPFIVDDGQTVADSTLIRWHLESQYQIDFDRHLSPREIAMNWALEKMCEEHLYFALIYYRWLYRDNFERGPAQFFAKVPRWVRPWIEKMAIRNVRKTLHHQGLGRHSEEELRLLVCRDLDALAVLLGDREWLGGEWPCATDASAGALMVSILCEQLPCPLLAHAQTHANLVAYAQRVRRHFFPQ